MSQLPPFRLQRSCACCTAGPTTAFTELSVTPSADTTAIQYASLAERASAQVVLPGVQEV